MRRLLAFLVLAAALLSGCARSSAPSDQQKTYALHGQIIAIDRANKAVTLKHDDIKGFMPAMTMPYTVKDMSVVNGLAPGDVVDGTLSVGNAGIFLASAKKVGTAPLPPAPAPQAASGPMFDLLKPGDEAPDASFVDQDGRARRFRSFKGQTVVLTFIYTRCPMPTFCPLMDRHFATIEKSLEQDPALKQVHLVSVSFDPAVDTPRVLKAHAKNVGADPRKWTFLTGKQDDVERFASRFGVSVVRSGDDGRDITHNLRTAILDPAGALVKVYTGNDWTPDQVLADLKH
jgi:protein SCO1/2